MPVASAGQPAAMLAEFVPLIHPARLASCLAPGLDFETIGKMQAAPRLHVRLARLAFGSAFPIEAEWGPDVLRGADPERVALLAGAVWHARSLLMLVSGQQLATLAQHVGRDIHSFGVRHVSHSVSEEAIDQPDRLADAIRRDGLACLRAWLGEYSPLERRRVILRLDPATPLEAFEFSPQHRSAAKSIVERVLDHLAATDGEP
ncbi:nodulation protein NolU [Terrihabitans sp. B22-R8]|uniref:nodulation protein NolU n=1 Tax=Terrihabitans sp. B22-R8 TaxID=3425128 RepID=UPI00403CE071